LFALTGQQHQQQMLQRETNRSAVERDAKLKQALDNLQSALTLRENLFKNDSGEGSLAIAESRNNVGMVHFARGEFEKALESFQGAVQLREAFDRGEATGELAEYTNNVGMALFVSRKRIVFEIREYFYEVQTRQCQEVNFFLDFESDG
jgi:tetratricopeptide (TPR) repeat protein